MDPHPDDHHEQARHIHGKLTDELQSLTLLEEELKRHAGQHLHQRLRLDRLSIAIGHLQQSLNELEAAAGD